MFRASCTFECVGLREEFVGSGELMCVGKTRVTAHHLTTKKGTEREGNRIHVQYTHVYVVYQVSRSIHWEPQDYPGSRHPPTDVSSGKCDRFPAVKATIRMEKNCTQFLVHCTVFIICLPA